MNRFLEQLLQVSTDTKYSKWYVSIVTRAQQRANKNLGYTERHHILPRSFKMGGEKDPLNIVRLTAREHFLCHVLLVRMVGGHFRHKMGRALMCMKRNPTGERYFNARLYERCRSFMKMSDETKVKLSKARIGKSMSDSAKSKMSEAGKRRHALMPFSEGTLNKLRVKNAGSLNPQAKSVVIEGTTYGTRQEAKRALGISLKNIDKIAKGECSTIEQATRRKSTKSDKPRGGNSTKRQVVVRDGVSYSSIRSSLRH